MEKKDIIEKICKCLALANSANANEAAAALVKAQSLMEKYGVPRQDVDLAEIGSKTADAHNSKALPAYIGMLITLIDRAVGCEAVLLPDWTWRGYRTSVEFIGVKPRPEIAAYAFDVLRRQLVRSRKQFVASLSKRMKRANKIRLADNWAEGWVMGAAKKVVNVTISDEDRRRIKDWKDRKLGELESCKSRPAKRMGQRGTMALIAGLVEGENVRIHPAATGDGRQAQIRHEG
jgi:hypothetical protein